MAFFDWNRDGKIDMQDAFLEYNIYKACTEDENDNDDLFDSDDEFDAQLQIFMDKNVLKFIRYETVWYAVSHLMKRLTEEMENQYI